MHFAEWSQGHQDPENQVGGGEVPIAEPPTKHVHFEDESHGHHHHQGAEYMAGGAQEFGDGHDPHATMLTDVPSIPASDPHATRLGPEHFGNSGDGGHSSASSPSDHKGTNMFAIGLGVVLLIAVGVVVFMVVNRKKGAAAPANPSVGMGDLSGGGLETLGSTGAPQTRDIFGSGALGDLEYL